MKSLYCSPETGFPIKRVGENFVSELGDEKFPIINEIPRFCKISNYTENFGYQWKKFDTTQLDINNNFKFSENRFYGSTQWDPAVISKEKILEVGSGAGRFSEVFLKTTTGKLHSIDYSNAVEVNLKNNYKYKERLVLSQASIYQMPFPDSTFDKVFCLGVLQHTPSFKKSIKSLVKKTKKGGEIVVDFYPINGWYTKIHSKYILRPLTKRLPNKTLLKLISLNVDWMIKIFDLLCFLKLNFLTRFIPITDISNFPKELSRKQRKEWAIMDTFDGFSPEFDKPMRIKDVKRIFIENGCFVTHAGVIKFKGGSATVVKGTKL